MKYVIYEIRKIGRVIVLIAAIIGTLPIIAGCDNTSRSPSNSWSSRPYNRYQNQKKREQEEAQRRIQLQQQQQTMEQLRRMSELQERNIQYVPVTSQSGTQRSNYAELWDECEYYSELLEENDIEHDDLSYPMDYHDLEDLRDNYESLLDENEIDY